MSVPAPIDEIPLFIKAGSIVPLGPLIQYATESADPLELRIYPGTDGKFTLYEDENDNYNYEKGFYSTIEFKWDEENQHLIIEDRKGKFPNMLNSRKFHVILVQENQGNGTGMTQNPDRIIQYQGKKEIIAF